MDFVFKPSVCSRPETPWGGTITLKMPKYVERKRMLREIGISVSSSGAVDMGSSDPVDMICKMVELVEKYVIKVEMYCDGSTFSSLDDLQTDPRADEILEEMATMFIGGLRLGKI
jgi:hypothetical protein